MCVYLCPGAISKFLHTNLHVSALCKVLEEASTICSDLSVLRRLSCAASTLHKDVPRYWDLVTEFGFQSTEDRSSIEKVQVLLENIQYMDTGTFDSDRCLMKELLDHQGFDGNPLGIVLVSSKKTCNSCTGKLRVRADRPSFPVICSDGLGTVSGTHFQK